VGGDPVVCTAKDACHAAGTCDTKTGACDDPIATDGTACDDGDQCTVSDACKAGVCTAGTPVKCVVKDQCHSAGTCDSATGECSDPAVADGTTCDDGSACTQDDSCQAGACVGKTTTTCTAPDDCHEDGTCDAETGACTNPVKVNGTVCATGTCYSGKCSAGGAVAPVSGCSCAAGAGSGAPVAFWGLVAIALAALRRRR
jgi:MYXO-CTERM domain-containing protein